MTRFKVYYSEWQRRTGRRSAILFCIAVILFGFGFGFFDRTASQLKAVYPLLEYIPPLYWGAIWMLCCLLCVIGIFWKYCQPVAYGLTSAVMLAWNANYIAAWVEHTIPRPYISLSIFLALSAIIFVCAGWKEDTSIATILERRRKKKMMKLMKMVESSGRLGE